MDLPVPELDKQEASHSVADWLMKFIDSILDKIGLHNHGSLEDVVYLLIVIAMAFVLGWVIQKLIYFVVRKAVQLRNGTIGRELLQWNTLHRCCVVIPPLVVLALAPFAFESTHHNVVIIERLAGIYSLIAFGVALNAVFDFIFNHYDLHHNTRRLPLKGIVNVAKGIVWIIIVIVCVSVALDKSPAILLTGLGAFAAALMLVFKDSILGFVSGIQMSDNDMLHVGDWIVVPNTPANGVVLDVSLTTVKVQNWDNTIVTVPPYTLVSGSFQNWRGMSQSGCRRIVKTFTIDLTTVEPIDDKTIDAIVAKYPIMKDFVDNLRNGHKTEQSLGGLTPINGTLETNLGLFRAYCCLFIYNNPEIDNKQQILVRLMDANADGLPLELYCFTATTDWNAYEGIQSALLEHIATTASDFGLGIYSSSTLTISEDKNQNA